MTRSSGVAADARIGLLLACLLLAAPALARSPEGWIDQIRTPNNGMPALAATGGGFDAVLAAKGELRLIAGERAVPLACQWEAAPGGGMLAHCTLPGDCPAGAYALEWRNEGGLDTNTRSVFVFDVFPEYYAIAHVSDTHLGKSPAAEEIDHAVFRAVNESGAAFAAVTGDLTEGGEEAQFQAVLRLLDTCVLPTFVCPGNHDRQGLNYERFFGPACYLFWFGKDGFLSYDTKDFSAASELGPQDGLIEAYRRAIKPARWAVGLTHRYEPMQGMRSQLVLFVDDPLDCLLFGHWHRENTAEQRTVPWGTTAITVVPAAIDGKYRIIDVTEKGLRPRPCSEIPPKEGR